MVRITKETDYGIMLLTYMAGLPQGEIRSAREAAEWSGLPLPTVSKILKNLAREKILDSRRGAEGGYSLKRAPETTSVADVIRAMEGPISLVQCGSDPGACDQESNCPTRVNWAVINQHVERALEQVPISQMIPRPGEPGPDSLSQLPGTGCYC